MPNANLRKSDKVSALHEIVKAKFLRRYEALMDRRRAIVERVYNETEGKMGNYLEKSAGKDFTSWLDTTNSFECLGADVPHLEIENAIRSRPPIDFFTGKNASMMNDYNYCQSLPRAVVKPNRDYRFKVDAKKATKATQKVTSNFNKDCKSFNEGIHQFYWTAYSILMNIRTTKQVDERFPELWEFLPDGLRESIKQAVVVFDQEEADKLREQVSGIKKIR